TSWSEVYWTVIPVRSLNSASDSLNRVASSPPKAPRMVTTPSASDSALSGPNPPSPAVLGGCGQPASSRVAVARPQLADRVRRGDTLIRTPSSWRRGTGAHDG